MFFEDRENCTYEFKIMYELGGAKKTRGYRLYVTKYVESGNSIKPKDNMSVFVRSAKKYVHSVNSKLNKILNSNKSLLLDLYFNKREIFVEKVFEIFK